MERITRRRRRRSGFTVIEAAVVSLILSVAMCGVVASIVTASQLERRTQRISRASSSAAATIEDIRAQARAGWSTVPTSWNGTATKVDGSHSTTETTLTSTIGQNTTDLTDKTGMFAPGATTPNFYFVNVQAAVTDPGIAAMKFQTYVGDRTRKVAPPGAVGTGFEDAVAGTVGSGTDTGTGGSGGDGGTTTTPIPDPTPVTYSTAAEAITPDPVSMTVSGTDGTSLALQLANRGSSAVALSRIKVVVKAGGAIKFVGAGARTFYDNTKGTTAYDSNNLKSALDLASGTFTVQVNGLVPQSSGKDRTTTLTLYFKDGSSRSLTVKP